MEELRKKVIEKLSEEIDKPYETDKSYDKLYALTDLLKVIINEPEYVVRSRYYNNYVNEVLGQHKKAVEGKKGYWSK